MYKSLSEEPLLAFVHIAKTAGTSFGMLLGHQVFRRHTCGVYQDTSISFAPSGTGVYEPEYAAEFLKRAKTIMPVNVFGKEIGIPWKREIKVVSGHMRYGIHKFLDEPVTYITFVRDPVSRVVSAYNYVRKMGFLPLETPIGDFLDSDFLGNSNAMVRQLVHDDTLDTKKVPALRGDAREVTERDYEAALSAIDSQFHMAAPTTRYDEAVLYLALTLGWPIHKLFTTPKNVTPPVVPRAEVTEEVRKKILSVNEWDARLYEACCERFETKVSGLAGQQKEVFETVLPLFLVYGQSVSTNTLKKANTEVFANLVKEVEALVAARVAEQD